VSIFPLTSVSAVAAAASDDAAVRERAVETIARAYWKPAYKYLRVRWSLPREDAEDLTQDFFARAARDATFARYDASAARFRTFVRACLDSTAKNAHTAAGRLKRGANAPHFSLSDDEFVRGEAELAGAAPPADDMLDEFFRREWLRSLFELAIHETRDELLGSGKHAHWTIFERYDLYDLAAHAPGERPTYGELATELDLPATQVTNFLAAARRLFRRVLLDRLRDQCATNAEYREEARELLGSTIA
jgi:DNA-directed RNA polymerase specialized sigma24 family protein